MSPEVTLDLLKSLVMLKLSPLLIGQVLRIVKTTTVPSGMCPAYVWPFNLSRIPAPLANEIMATLSKILGI